MPGCYVKISLIKDIFSREGLATADQGPFAHATHSPERSGTCPHARNFPGFVQFSVPAFQHPPVQSFQKIALTQHSPLCTDAGGADGHFRPHRRHPQTPPDPGNDGAQARPVISATPGFLCAPLIKVDASRRAEKCRSLRVQVELWQCACACVIGDARVCATEWARLGVRHGGCLSAEVECDGAALVSGSASM